MPEITFQNASVSDVFAQYPHPLRDKLLAMRRLIFEVARETDGVGEIQETLKWGQPSYRTPISRSGTTIRIDQCADDASQFGMFVHCQTTLIETFRTMFGDQLTYDGTRALIFDTADDIPTNEVRECIALALTYHKRKKT